MKRKASHIIALGRARKRVFEVAVSIRRDRIGAYAAESAFFIMLSSIPFLMLLVTVAGYVISDEIYEYIELAADALPSVIGEEIKSEIISLVERPISAPLSLSALGMFISASRGIRSVRRGVRSVYGHDGGGAVTEIISSLIFTASFTLIITAVLVFFVFGSALRTLISENFPTAAPLIDFTVSLSPLLFFSMLVLFFAAVFHTFAPKNSVNSAFREHIPGAVVSSAGWVLFSLAFSIFIDNFSNMSYIYGSLAVIMILMLWLYMIMYILLIGAEINKMLAGVRRPPIS
ncbi:MAG: YihY/virulence factor BrkB family protein [Firmicutes bacterium]|nr:YihY/virulence factor BrkB family protein [Bacillota bacterium]